MNEAHTDGFPTWEERKGLSVSAMSGWTSREWELWWGEGLEFWFSDYSRADRLEAFAPLQIMPGAEDPDERLPRLLYQLYGQEWVQDAERSRRVQEGLEAGALRVAGNRRFMTSYERARLLVRVFSALSGERMGDLLHLVVAADGRDWLAGSGGDELASAISYALFDLAQPDDLGDARLHFEDMLERRPNFRPALYYSMKLYPTDFGQCLAKFEQLWTSRPAHDAPEVWRAVAAELSGQYGERVVARQIRDLIEGANVRDMDGYVFAVRLVPFLPRHSEPQGIFQKAWFGTGSQPVQLSEKRGLSTEYSETDDQLEEARELDVVG